MSDNTTGENRARPKQPPVLQESEAEVQKQKNDKVSSLKGGEDDAVVELEVDVVEVASSDVVVGSGDDVVIFRTSDGLAIPVEKEVALRCGAVRRRLKNGDVDEDNGMTFDNVSGAALVRVVDYCRYEWPGDFHNPPIHNPERSLEEQKRLSRQYEEKRYPKNLGYGGGVSAGISSHMHMPRPRATAKFESYLSTADPSILCELASASYYLDVKPLVDLTCRAIADTIKGKSPEEIRTTFNIVNDFTPSEEEQVRRSVLHRTLMLPAAATVEDLTGGNTSPPYANDLVVYSGNTQNKMREKLKKKLMQRRNKLRGSNSSRQLMKSDKDEDIFIHQKKEITENGPKLTTTISTKPPIRKTERHLRSKTQKRQAARERERRMKLRESAETSNPSGDDDLSWAELEQKRLRVAAEVERRRKQLNEKKTRSNNGHQQQQQNHHQGKSHQLPTSPSAKHVNSYHHQHEQQQQGKGNKGGHKNTSNSNSSGIGSNDKLKSPVNDSSNGRGGRHSRELNGETNSNKHQKKKRKRKGKKKSAKDSDMHPQASSPTTPRTRSASPSPSNSPSHSPLNFPPDLPRAILHDLLETHRLKLQEPPKHSHHHRHQRTSDPLSPTHRNGIHAHHNAYGNSPCGHTSYDGNTATQTERPPHYQSSSTSVDDAHKNPQHHKYPKPNELRKTSSNSHENSSFHRARRKKRSETSGENHGGGRDKFYGDNSIESNENNINISSELDDLPPLELFQQGANSAQCPFLNGNNETADNLENSSRTEKSGLNENSETSVHISDNDFGPHIVQRAVRKDVASDGDGNETIVAQESDNLYAVHENQQDGAPMSVNMNETVRLTTKDEEDSQNHATDIGDNGIDHHIQSEDPNLEYDVDLIRSKDDEIKHLKQMIINFQKMFEISQKQLKEENQSLKKRCTILESRVNSLEKQMRHSGK